MKFKNLMLALAVTMMVASCDKKKEGDATEKEGTEAAAEAGKEVEAEAPVAAPEADAKTMITKTWVIEEMDVTAMIAKQPKEKQEEMKKKMAENMSKVKGNMIFEFKADGTFVNTMKDGKQEIKNEGTWSLSEDGKTLTTAEAKGGKKSDVKVMTLTNDNLDLAPDGADMVMKFVPKK